MAELALPAAVLEAVRVERPVESVFLANRSPEPGAVAVPRTAPVVLEVLGFPEALVGQDRLEVWVGGEAAFTGARSPPFARAYASPVSAVLSVPGGMRLTLQPRVAFRSQQDVPVRVVFRDPAGRVLLEQAYAFEVEDVTAPRLLAAEATSPTRVRLSFDEPVRVADIEVEFVPLDVPAVPLVVTSAAAEGSLVELALSPEMTPDVRYELRVRGVVDGRGNPVQSPDDVAVFRGYRVPRPPNRRFDLWSMLPGYNRRHDDTGDLRKLIASFQDVLDLLLADIDRFADIFDLERAPELFLDFLLLDLGNPFEFVLNELDKRRLAVVLVELYKLKGTEKGILNAARFFLGLEIDAITSYSGASPVLGESLLGVDWALGPANRFALYAFDVHVSVPLTDQQRERLRALVLWAKPCHTHLVSILTPIPPVDQEFWIVGESDLGLNTLLA